MNTLRVQSTVLFALVIGLPVFAPAQERDFTIALAQWEATISEVVRRDLSAEAQEELKRKLMKSEIKVHIAKAIRKLAPHLDYIIASDLVARGLIVPENQDEAGQQIDKMKARILKKLDASELVQLREQYRRGLITNLRLRSLPATNVLQTIDDLILAKACETKVSPK